MDEIPVLHLGPTEDVQTWLQKHPVEQLTLIFAELTYKAHQAGVIPVVCVAMKDTPEAGVVHLLTPRDFPKRVLPAILEELARQIRAQLLVS